MFDHLPVKSIIASNCLPERCLGVGRLNSTPANSTRGRPPYAPPHPPSATPLSSTIGHRWFPSAQPAVDRRPDLRLVRQTTPLDPRLWCQNATCPSPRLHYHDPAHAPPSCQIKARVEVSLAKEDGDNCSPQNAEVTGHATIGNIVLVQSQFLRKNLFTICPFRIIGLREHLLLVAEHY